MNHEAFNPRLSADIDGHAMRVIDEGVCNWMVTPGTICDYSPRVQQRVAWHGSTPAVPGRCSVAGKALARRWPLRHTVRFAHAV